MRNPKETLFQLSTNEKLNLIVRSNLVNEEIVVRLPCKMILRVFPLGFNGALYLAVCYSQQSDREGKK